MSSNITTVPMATTVKKYKNIHNTRNPDVARIAYCTGCQWPSRSSKVNDLQVIWKPTWNFLLVINSNLGPILYRLATPIRDGWTDRRTDNNHDNSLTITKVRSAKKPTNQSVNQSKHTYVMW